ncbi:MAG: hypothetical protein ACRDDX_10670 [Cellulosilyticaceae bacterium]
MLLSERIQSMPLSKWVEIVNPIYVIYKIIPHTSTRNYDTSSIASVMATMKATIKKDEKKYFVESKLKCAYMIDIYKADIQFYFIVPQQYKIILRDKMEQNWPRSTIEEVDKINGFDAKSVLYEVKYKNHDALALNADKKSNVLLNNLLNVVDVMEDGDRVTILYNFTHTSNWGWLTQAEKVHDKWMQNVNVPKVSTKGSVAFNIFCYVLEFVERFIDELLGDQMKEYNPIGDLNDALRQKVRVLSADSKNKRNDLVINTQIGVVSYSENQVRANNNALVACQSFYSLKGDNELEYEKKISCKIDLHDASIGTTQNKIGINESSALIQLPGKELLEKHKITHVNVTETDIPAQLQTGTMCIGESTCKGNTQEAYLSSDKSFKYLTLCLIGPTRAGKTTLISNLCHDSSKSLETNILFDWCGNCDLSDDVIESLKNTGVNVLTIDGSNMSTIQGLGYNELYTDSTDSFEVYRAAKQQATQLMTLINASQGGDEDLRARMERYLGAAALIVFLQNGPIRDVFQILQQHKLRDEYIKGVPVNQNENVSEYIAYLKELDEVKDVKTTTKDADGKEVTTSKKEVVGTKLSAVQGILNRGNKLKENPYMEMMLKKDCKHNFNLVDEIQKAQLICIKMPEHMFATEQEKDTYATYWLTKLWGALQQRKWKIQDGSKRVKVNMYFDELYQVESCQEFLRSKLSQIAKFGAKPIISCHYLGQIPGIRNELKSANTSYVMISGSDKDNYKELKDELQPYTLEDLLNLKRYHAINLIKYEEGWARFITKLPKPIN